jgi:hypothetical protein
MENPHELPAPTDPLERIHAFALDLAYGVSLGFWGTWFEVIYALAGNSRWSSDIQALNDKNQSKLSELLAGKWGENPPSENALVSFGYFEDRERNGRLTHLLMEKAFALLDKPLAPPTIFISYKRDQSSTFALLIEARLKMAGNPNPFIDKNIVAGDDWHGRLQEVIEQARYFICLIGPNTLSSPHVRKEIGWAEKAGCTIISIWHSCAIDDITDCPPILQNRHAIQVSGESARQYETAISELLNALGYSTY